VPFVTIALRAALAFVVLGLFQAQKNSVDHFFPILKLNATPDDRQSRSPIFFRCAIVLLGNRQIVQRRKRRSRKLSYQRVFELL